jgi:hypothetical protein
MKFSLLFASIFMQAVLHKEFVVPKSDKLLGTCGLRAGTRIGLSARGNRHAL